MVSASPRETSCVPAPPAYFSADYTWAQQSQKVQLSLAALQISICLWPKSRGHLLQFTPKQPDQPLSLKPRHMTPHHLSSLCLKGILPYSSRPLFQYNIAYFYILIYIHQISDFSFSQSVQSDGIIYIIFLFRCLFRVCIAIKGPWQCVWPCLTRHKIHSSQLSPSFKSMKKTFVHFIGCWNKIPTTFPKMMTVHWQSDQLWWYCIYVILHYCRVKFTLRQIRCRRLF